LPTPPELPAVTVWRREPFRVLFPLGVVLGWVGIGHWLTYALGVTQTYSCLAHGLVQMEAFMMAFAAGFLLTALPRRTQTSPPSAIEMWLAAGALVATTLAATEQNWVAAQVGYVALFVVLLQFAVRRFVGRAAGRRPPAAFVLIPIGIAYGLTGAGLIVVWAALGASPTLVGLARLLIEQGVFLCFAIGVGSLVRPLMGGSSPPADLGSSPRERWRAIVYAALGVALGMTLMLEHLGWERIAPLLRALLVGGSLVVGGRAWEAPGKPGLHRRLVWISVWLMPLGLALSGLVPSYRVPALHILFIGGFSLMAFGVATHVTLSHVAGLEPLALGRPPAVVALGVALLLALLARVAADWSNSYFAHLGWAAGCWIAGSAVWLGFLGPRMLRRYRE
jgi:uncharacterized protein involved in response to NO